MLKRNAKPKQKHRKCTKNMEKNTHTLSINTFENAERNKSLEALSSVRSHIRE